MMIVKRYRRAYIEIMAACNLRCPFCPASTIGSSRPSMSRALFEHCVEQSAPLVQELSFHVLGEPLLHPSLLEFIDLSHRAGLGVNITTNGLLLETMAQGLLEAQGLRQVNLSVHNLMYLENADQRDHLIDTMVQFCQKMLAAQPNCYLNLRLWRQDFNAPSLKHEHLSTSLNRGLERHLGHSLPPAGNHQVRRSLRISQRLYVHYDSPFSWPGTEQVASSPRQKGTCHGLNDHFAILANGNVVPCCLDWQGNVSLGNIAQDDLADILDSPRAQTMHQGFLQGQLVEAQCQTCDFARRLKFSPGREKRG